MRELKFRAWGNEHNRYCDLVTLIEDSKWVGWIKSSGVYLTTTDIVLEQYTGLKDKNGKEIYEGDILLDDTGEPLEYWRVRYIWGKFVGECNLVSEDIFELRGLEVIGNIHENPELLEGGE